MKRNNEYIQKCKDISKVIGYSNESTEHFKSIFSHIKKIVKDISNNDIDYDSRYGKAIRELEQLEDILYDDELDFSKYVYSMSLAIDCVNNVAHDTKNSIVKKDFFDIKSLVIYKMEQQINQNRDKMDIISGYQSDFSKDVNKNVYVVDIPGVGQVSWHIDGYTFGKLQDVGMEDYPYKLELSSNNMSDLLLYNIKEQPKDMPHNYLVQTIPDGEENTLRDAIDIFENYKHDTYKNEGKERIIKRLGREKVLSETMIENLSKGLRVSYANVKDEREKYIKEENERQVDKDDRL